jgi:hypothetical protein
VWCEAGGFRVDRSGARMISHTRRKEPWARRRWRDKTAGSNVKPRCSHWSAAVLFKGSSGCDGPSEALKRRDGGEC